MRTQLHQLTATEAVDLIKNREISAVDLSKSCIQQINQYDSQTKAWVFFDENLILRKAEAIDKRIKNTDFSGLRADILLGVPYGIKDTMNTADMPTQMGSPIWKNFMPGNDARVIDSLNLAGALPLGKTVTAEFSVHAPNDTLNPYDSTRMTGTSSSGSAVAVATRMCPFALGTQTGGSIMRPASYNGIFAMKPSFGLLPRTGTLKTTDTLDTIGFMSRSVDDLKLLLDVMRVRGKNYPISYQAMHDKDRQEKPKNRCWKIAVVKGPKWNFAELYAQEALESFTKNLAKCLEVNVEERSDFDDCETAYQIHADIYDTTLAYYFKEEFRQHRLISDCMNAMISRGKTVSLAQYKFAIEEQERYAKQADDFFENNGIDAVINLTTGGEALEGRKSVDRPDNCLFWTLNYLPCINIPAFKGPNGLPFGLQLVGRRYEDYKLLQLAKEIESSDLFAGVPVPNCIL